jgi:enterochelin esterase family protein
MNKMIVPLFVAILVAALAHAQQPTLNANQPMIAPLVSPQVQADRSIVYRISVPTAPDVQLRFDGKNYPMTKGEKGVWSTTVGPVAPGLYAYSFGIAGAQFNNGEVEVSGTPAPDNITQDVPHGTITLHQYFSRAQNRRRTLRVYLPAQYYAEPTRKFPVLYIFSGGGETSAASATRHGIILDNLIAQGKAVPMAIVMPSNSTNSGDGTDAVFPDALDNMAGIEKELQTDIFPMIEKDYRVYTDKNHRAIAGWSFGGGTAFGVGMRHLDWFGNIGEFATGLFGGADTPPPGHTNYIAFEPDAIAPGMIKKLLNPATKPKVFYMAVGDRDPRSPYQKKAYEDFRKAGVDVSFRTFPGGHGGNGVDSSLPEFVTLIFK